jgi:hypothetical protein
MNQQSRKPSTSMVIAWYKQKRVWGNYNKKNRTAVSLNTQPDNGQLGRTT